jgi:hypothetical protein
MSSWSSLKKGLGTYKNPASYYNSPVIHTVTLQGVTPGSTYHYRVAGDDRVHSFRMPPPSGSISGDGFPVMTIGLVADLGQTAVSNASVTALQSMQPDVVLLAGDLSYVLREIRERWRH